jgi:hypothetical protein
MLTPEHPSETHRILEITIPLALGICSSQGAKKSADGLICASQHHCNMSVASLFDPVVKREREKVLLDKAESLMTAIYAHRDWLRQT